MKLTYLRELDDADLEVLKKIPALVTILTGTADDDLNEKETHMGKVSTEFRKNHGEELVQDYFEWVSEDYDNIFDKAWEQYKNVRSYARTQQISDELAKVNDILPKIDKKYAHSLVVSWRGLSRAVAHASGGILGRIAVSNEEKDVMGLNMIDLQ